MIPLLFFFAFIGVGLALLIWSHFEDDRLKSEVERIAEEGRREELTRKHRRLKAEPRY